MSTKEERAAERARLCEDATTRMPRVVRLTANEARTLDPDPLRKQSTTFTCGHLSAFWENAGAMQRCVVSGCTYEIWDVFREQHEQRENAERRATFREIRNLRRWNFAGAVLIIVAFVLGKWVV